MDTPKIKRMSKRLSIGKSRLMAPKVPLQIEKENIQNTPPNEMKIKENLQNECYSPLFRKKTFITEESPSQDNDSFVVPATQVLCCEFQDVGWEWGEPLDKPMRSRDKKKSTYEIVKNKKENKVSLASKSKCTPHEKHKNNQFKLTNSEKGFHVFKKEVEIIKRSNSLQSRTEFGESAKENRGFENSEVTGLQSELKIDSLIEMKIGNSVSEENKNIDKATEKCSDTSYFNDSDVDAMLLEATQSVEKNYVEKFKPPSTNQTKPELIDNAAFNSNSGGNFEGDSIDEFLCSITDDELFNYSQIATTSAHVNFYPKRVTKFIRCNSMPQEASPKPESSVTKTLNRHNSMPQDSQDLTPVSVAKNPCTKIEMENKRLEAKKRQLRSQQRRLMLKLRQGSGTNVTNSLSKDFIKPINM